MWGGFLVAVANSTDPPTACSARHHHTILHTTCALIAIYTSYIHFTHTLTALRPRSPSQPFITLSTTSSHFTTTLPPPPSLPCSVHAGCPADIGYCLDYGHPLRLLLTCCVAPCDRECGCACHKRRGHRQDHAHHAALLCDDQQHGQGRGAGRRYAAPSMGSRRRQQQG